MQPRQRRPEPSPRREPWERTQSHVESPGRGGRTVVTGNVRFVGGGSAMTGRDGPAARRIHDSFAPAGAFMVVRHLPTACAVGWVLTPLPRLRMDGLCHWVSSDGHFYEMAEIFSSSLDCQCYPAGDGQKSILQFGIVAIWNKWRNCLGDASFGAPRSLAT